MANIAKIYQGEAKPLPFRIKDRRTGQNLDLTNCSFLLWVKRTPEDEDPVFTKEDIDFDTAAAASGYVTVFLAAYDTWQPPWTYKAELRVIKTGTPVPIEKIRFDLEIMRAITPTDWILALTGMASAQALGTPTITAL